jgi:hypothetical protein
LVAEDDAHTQVKSNGPVTSSPSSVPTSASSLPGVFVDESDGASVVSNLSTTSSRRRMLKMKMRNPLRKKKKSSLESVVEEVVCGEI